MSETFIERVELGPGPKSNKSRSNRGASGPALDAINRWKKLEREGWDVEALGAVDGSHMIGLGCRYLSATERAEASG